MKNNENQYTVYLRSTRQWVPVTEQQFKDYYRDIDAFRKKQQRHGKCICPESKRLMCDTDCATCPYQTQGDTLSLDFSYETEDGSETTLGDMIEDDTPLFSELLADRMEMERLFKRLRELMPEAVEIGRLRLEGLKDKQIADRIGIKRTTFQSRLEVARKILREEFPELL